MFWKTTHDDLNSEISKLDSKISASQSVFGNYLPHRWNEVFDLIKDIRERF